MNGMLATTSDKRKIRTKPLTKNTLDLEKGKKQAAVLKESCRAARAIPIRGPAENNFTIYSSPSLTEPIMKLLLQKSSLPR